MDDQGWLETRAGTGRALSSPRDSWASLPAWVAQLQRAQKGAQGGGEDATGADQDWQNKEQERRPRAGLPTPKGEKNPL